MVIGRSNIVGRPVTTFGTTKCNCHPCHSRQRSSIVDKIADIVAVAVGRPNMITGEHLKEGCVVTDVGINRMEDGSLVGDADRIPNKASILLSWWAGPLTINLSKYLSFPRGNSQSLFRKHFVED